MGVAILTYVSCRGKVPFKELQVIHTRVEVWMSPPREEMAGHILQLSRSSLSFHLT